MRHIHRNSGFVLLMVLVVLLIAGTLMTATARRHCAKAIEAGRAERDLQLRWGSRSCGEFFMPMAEVLLTETAEPGRRTIVSVCRSIRLGKLDFHVTIGDEQAKANVNLLAARKGREALAARLRELHFGRGLPVQVILKPERPVQRSRDSKAAKGRRGARQQAPVLYASLHQVLDFDHPSELFQADTVDLLADRITCWGDGRLNFKRAEVPVIREVTSGVIGERELHQLAEFRDRSPDCTLDEALAHLKLEKHQLDRLRGVLTDTSRCHSIWIVAEGRSRRWYRLYVEEAGNDSVPEGSRWVFEW